MERSKRVPCAVCAFTLCVAVFAALPARAQNVQQKPEVIRELHHDTSLPLRELVRIYGSVAPAPQNRVAPLGRSGNPYPITSTEPDAAVDLQNAGLPPVSATTILNFDGLTDSQSGGVAPPDTNGSVGATQFVQTVNTAYAIYDKTTGAKTLGPSQIKTVFANFGGVCQSGPFYSDPIVLYDKMAQRWVISIIGSSNGFSTGTECVAVSTSSDATSTYNRYAFTFGSSTLGDYPKLASWPDAYYLTVNIFKPFFSGADACALDRAEMLAGTTASMICFQQSSSIESLLPSDFDGTTAPPAGEPNFFVSIAPNQPGSSLNLFKFHVDFTTPTNSTFTGPTVLSVAAYNQACGGNGTCIPQASTTQQLDSLGDRLMFRNAYRNLGSHESLVVDHSVNPGVTGIVGGVRWYEIQNPNGTPVIFQQGTFANNKTNYWMGSIAMDKNGDIALGFSASSKTTHPGIFYTGRVPTDPLGKMETLSRVVVGLGSQTGGLSRWGDYSSLAIDPVDDCTFWYTTEYLRATGSFNWNTRIASFKFNSCQ